ncbi:MAG: Smr/MutS family protein, partial [Oscillospiraceae bacterium]
MKIINLEAGMPTVEFAHSRLGQELRTAKSCGEKVVKIIHGYGSSGRGGAIKTDVLATLAQKKRAGQIKDYVRGEDFSPFSESARRMVTQFPAMTHDSDWS